MVWCGCRDEGGIGVDEKHKTVFVRVCMFTSMFLSIPISR